MDGRIPYALILCWIRVVSASLLPPTNVTLHCHNTNNTLLWSYEELSQGLRFKVEVGSIQSSGTLVELWVESPATTIDLSEFSEPDNEHVVFVSAVNGNDMSDPVPEEGITFSYFKDSATVTKKCGVDLPVVNVTTIEDNLLQFRFEHPARFYPIVTKSRKKKSLDSKARLTEFVYHVEVINQSESHNFRCTESVCQGKLPVHGNLKTYCLNITGEMRKMSVQATKKYCSKPQESAAGTILLAIVIPIVFLVLIIALSLLVYFNKTRPTTIPITSLSFPINGHNSTSPDLTTQEYSPLDVVLDSPPPLTLDQDTVTSSDTYRDEFRQPLGLPFKKSETEPGPETEPEPGPGPGPGVPDVSDVGYTHGMGLDGDEEEEEEEPTPYEKRPFSL